MSLRLRITDASASHRARVMGPHPRPRQHEAWETGLLGDGDNSHLPSRRHPGASCEQTGKRDWMLGEAKQATSVRRECEGRRGGAAAPSQAWFLIATLRAGCVCSWGGRGGNRGCDGRSHSPKLAGGRVGILGPGLPVPRAPALSFPSLVVVGSIWTREVTV